MNPVSIFSDRVRRPGRCCARKPAPQQHALIPLRPMLEPARLSKATPMTLGYFNVWSLTRFLRRFGRQGLTVLLLAFVGNWSGAQEANPAPANEANASQTTNGVADPKPAVETVAAKEAPGREAPEQDLAAPPTVTNSGTTANTTTTSSQQTYEAFRLIADRNIFDQSRSPRSARSTTTGGTLRAPRVESFALVGTMSYAKGDFAFFDGTSPQYRTVLKVGDTIGAYNVKEVASNQVKLSGKKQELELKVGQQLRREDEGEWQVSARSDSVTSLGSSSAAPNESLSSGTAEVSDVLKRMMEKREKELNK
jgi:hypothetical protein